MLLSGIQYITRYINSDLIFSQIWNGSVTICHCTKLVHDIVYYINYMYIALI